MGGERTLELVAIGLVAPVGTHWREAGRIEGEGRMRFLERQTWLVKSVWPHEEGWRDELEALVSSPPA